MKKIRTTAGKTRMWKRIVWNEKTDFSVKFTTKVRFALKGFSANEYVWYGLEHNDYHEYISEFERMESRKINGPYKFILDDKLVFEEIFSKYTRVPVNYAWISDGILYGLHDYQVNRENLIDFLCTVGKSVLKRLSAGGGSGTYVFEASKEGILVNQKPMSEDAIRELFNAKGQHILCEYMEQSGFSASLYPHTTNTIRLVCAKKRGEQSAQLINAIQRIGCEASIPVDNAHGGGLSASINLETGELGCGMARLGKMENRMIPFEKHPDSSSQIKGTFIPEWRELVKDVVRLTNQIPYLNFVAWDILLTPEGYCVIEGNASSGCGIFQMEHGIRNSSLGDIYRSYNII